MQDKNPAAVALGKLGGKSKSEAKKKTARVNGKKGGRPKKKPILQASFCLEGGQLTFLSNGRDIIKVRLSVGVWVGEGTCPTPTSKGKGISSNYYCPSPPSHQLNRRGQ